MNEQKPFTPDQLDAIDISKRHLDACVVAGPGSGKTTVLVEYFKRLVENGVDPLRILDEYDGRVAQTGSLAEACASDPRHLPEHLAAAGHSCCVVASALADTAEKRDQTLQEQMHTDCTLAGTARGCEAWRRGNILIYPVAERGRQLSLLREEIQDFQPDWVLVYGDTNSTIAGALSAVKQHFPVAHLEAGLRSFNRRMPEEHNRVLTDHCADVLLAPTEEAMRHLAHEGLGDRAVLAGDVMVDICLRIRDVLQAGAARGAQPEPEAGPGG